MTKIEKKKEIFIESEFPEIEVKTTQGDIKLPHEYKRKWFILFIYPGDFTPVSATEFITFSKHKDQLTNLNCHLVGMSLDGIYSHLKWMQWFKEEMETSLFFPIIAGNHEIYKILGIPSRARKIIGIRKTIIVNPKGIIKAILDYPRQIGRNVNEIIRIVEALKTAEEQDAMAPANWPDNDLIKNRVVLFPAENEQAIEDTPIELRRYAWWFCYKSLNEDV
ncbi:MAG: peroxiredoxin [Promethearchaeota archaeon]